MTMQEIFEGNRERLTAAVSGADPVSAVPVLNAELDRMLYTFNDQEENPRVREAAGAMMQVAKAACALVDTAGETKIYGRTEYGEAAPVKGKASRWGLLLLVLGLLGAAAAVSGVLFDRGINILNISQTILEGYFSMVMIVDLSEPSCPFDELQEELKALGRELGLQIRIQKTEIFEAMHQI